ncbi:MAG: accessory gene regulator B family protein [Clostridium sp.]|nr:accessory gene regulator B family protein [Clostridium sp.]
MIEYWAGSFVEKQARGKMISEEEAAVYRYGYTLLAELGINLILSVVIGAAAGQLLPLFFFLLIILPLRSYCGGYHADSFWRCTLLSGAVTALALWAARRNLPGCTVPALAAAGIWIFLILSLAPCPCEEKPLGPLESKKYRKIGRIFLAAEVFLEIIFWYSGQRLLFDLIWLAHGIVAISLVMGHDKNRRRRKQNRVMNIQKDAR